MFIFDSGPDMRDQEREQSCEGYDEPASGGREHVRLRAGHNREGYGPLVNGATSVLFEPVRRPPQVPL